jgi:raffinose/stachyose/melibiose transport system permease protein
MAREVSFVGLQNYVEAVADGLFWTSFGLTFRFVFFAILLTNLVAFALAGILTKGFKGAGFYKAAFFAPNLIGGILLGLIWRFIFIIGITEIGEFIGIQAMQRSMLSSANGAFWALVIVFVWQMSGYMMIIYIAGFVNVPRDLLEAAAIDGATGFQKLRRITLPMMMPSFTICLFLTLQRSFMTYDINLSLTAGGPFHSTELVAMRIYNRAFVAEQYGMGQSQAFMLFLIVVIVTLIQVFLTKRMEVEA